MGTHIFWAAISPPPLLVLLTSHCRISSSPAAGSPPYFRSGARYSQNPPTSATSLGLVAACALQHTTLQYSELYPLRRNSYIYLSTYGLALDASVCKAFVNRCYSPSCVGSFNIKDDLKLGLLVAHCCWTFLVFPFSALNQVYPAPYCRRAVLPKSGTLCVLSSESPFFRTASHNIILSAMNFQAVLVEQYPLPVEQVNR